VYYIENIIVNFSVFVTVAAAIRMFSGKSGYLSVMHAVFFGVGAYVYAQLLVNSMLPWGLSLVIAVIASGLLALLLGTAIFRTKSDQFAVATIVAQILFVLVALNLSAFTNGPLGISGIPKGPMTYFDGSAMVIFVLIAILSIVMIGKFESSRYGMLLTAIKEDDLLAESLGHNVGKVRLMAFALSALIAGMVGALYAQYISYIEPASFGLDESILFLTIAILAGSGSSLWRLCFGGVVIVIFPELVRHITSISTFDLNLRNLFVGIILCLATWRMAHADSAKFEG